VGDAVPNGIVLAILVNVVAVKLIAWRKVERLAAHAVLKPGFVLVVLAAAERLVAPVAALGFNVARNNIKVLALASNELAAKKGGCWAFSVPKGKPGSGCKDGAGSGDNDSPKDREKTGGIHGEVGMDGNQCDANLIAGEMRLDLVKLKWLEWRRS